MMNLIQFNFFKHRNVLPNEFIFRSFSNIRIKQFVRKLEKKLKLEDKIKFSKVGFLYNLESFHMRISNQFNYKPSFDSNIPLQEKYDEYAMRVKIPDWWLEQQVRFSFLTAFMKSAINISSWDHIFLISDYFKNTPGATERFLSGHTHYVGRGKQWVKTFQSSRETNKLKKSPKED